MPTIPSLPMSSRIIPLNNAIDQDVSEGGTVGAIDFGVDAFYDVELNFKKLLKSQVDTLDTFFTANENETVTTPVLGDGNEYVGFMKRPPVIDSMNAIRHNVTLELRCWRGLVGGYLTRHNEEGIVGSSPVTAWNNSAVSGSDYDFDTVVGTAANLVTTTVNGLTAIEFDGTVNLKTATAPADNIVRPMIFAVARVDAQNFNYMFDGTDSLDRIALAYFNGAPGASMFAGQTVTSSGGALGSDFHVYSLDYNEGSSTVDVSDHGSATGNAGDREMQYATMGAQSGNGARFDGVICEFVLYDDTSLTQSQIDQNVAFLAKKWGI